MEKTLFKDEYKILLEQLRNIRIKSGLKQSEIAKKLKVNQSFISKIETGERRLDLIELREYCNALDIKMSNFIKNFEKIVDESK